MDNQLKEDRFQKHSINTSNISHKIINKKSKELTNLYIKYDELNQIHKNMMNEYANLRSDLEDYKSINGTQNIEIKKIKEKIKENDENNVHFNELCSKELLLKDSNTKEINKIIEKSN